MRKLRLILFLTVIWFVGLGQTLETLTAPELRTVAKIMNEAKSCNQISTTKDSLLKTKDKKIEILTAIEQARADMVIRCNKELISKESEIKILKHKLIFWKVATLAGIIGTIYILK